MFLPIMKRARTFGNLTALFAIAVVFLYNAEYIKMDFDVCSSTDNRIRVLYGLSLEKCVYECGRRPGCQRLNYKLARKECGLFNESHSIQSDKDLKCSVVTREEIDPDQQLCKCKIGMACQKNGTCQYEECPPIPQMDPTRGVIKGNMQNIGAKVKVQCNEGYTRIPDKQPVVCGNDGQWGEIPDCLRCPSVPQLDNGVVKGNNQNIGATVRVQCNEGYTRIPDKGTVVCGNDGQWGEFPECLWNCSEPCPRLPYTSDVSVGGTLEGDTRNYTCQDGLYVNDTSQSQNITIVCTLEGWNYGDISSQLCVSDETYPNKPENAMRMKNCMILEFNGDQKSYEESRQQCSRYGDLVKMDTAEKQIMLQEYMSTYHNADREWYWIQGTRKDGEWRFSDGTLIDQHLWPPGEPSGSSNCIIISQEDEWMLNNRYCWRTLRYICEYTDK